MATFQFRIGMFHFFAAYWIAKYTTFMTGPSYSHSMVAGGLPEIS
jgi:hypothetical protein